MVSFLEGCSFDFLLLLQHPPPNPMQYMHPDIKKSNTPPPAARPMVAASRAGDGGGSGVLCGVVEGCIFVAVVEIINILVV